MKKSEYNKHMRRFLVDDHVMLPDTWIILHVDGDNFSEFTLRETVNKDGDRVPMFKKPFDKGLHESFCELSEKLMSDLGGTYAYTQFDEVSVLFPHDYDGFNRNIGKLISKSVSIASSLFSKKYGTDVYFATHVYTLPARENILDYIKWRIKDCEKNALTTYVYWLLIDDDGLSPSEAGKTLNGMNSSDKNELLFNRGINYNDIPAWQKRGTEFLWSTFLREGYNPKEDTNAIASRSRIYQRDAPNSYDVHGKIDEILYGIDLGILERLDGTVVEHNEEIYTNRRKHEI